MVIGNNITRVRLLMVCLGRVIVIVLKEEEVLCLVLMFVKMSEPKGLVWDSSKRYDGTERLILESSSSFLYPNDKVK